MFQIKFDKTKISDIDKVLCMENDVDNFQFITANTRADHVALLEEDDSEHLLIKTEQDKIIGFVILAGLYNVNKNIEFRRIVIQEKGKGYGRAAVQKIKKYCFNELGCNRLWLDVFENNTRARRLYKSEGFIEEEIIVDVKVKNNLCNNLIIMSIQNLNTN